jgi:hypothetical protein
MRVAYHYPYPDTIYAHRTIYNGFKSAFQDLGHTFLPVTPDHDLSRRLEEERIDLFITSSHFVYRKYVDYRRLARLRNRGLFVLTKIDFWNSPLGSMRFNEAKGLRDDPEVVDLIKSGLLGDACYHVVEQDDARMDGFTQTTGEPYHTIPLAADKTLSGEAAADARFVADISFIGTYLPEKRPYFDRMVFPLARKHRLRLYGQDWTRVHRTLGLIQKVGQYFNLPLIKSLQKPNLALGDEARIYASSQISINVHEAYQRKFGGDCNERTFKIPLFGGFEITDDVACIRRYFEADHEIVVADGETDWFDKIEHYLRYPEQRLPIIEAGRARVLKDHTYHNRVDQMIAIATRQKRT